MEVNYMTKKILFIVTQSEFGGAQRFLWNLISGLTQIVKQKDADIVVAAGPEGDDENGLLRFLEKKGINTKHLKYLRRGVNPLFDYLGTVEILGLIKKEKPDILFLCSSKAGFLGSLAARLYKSALQPKVIYRIGGWAFNDPRPFWQKLLYKFIEKISARWKDVIIVNAECHRKQAIELGIKPRGEILTIYNGIDINNLVFFDKEQAREKLNYLISNSKFLISNLPRRQAGQIPNSKFQILNSVIIGTIANLYPAKGIEYLIEAAKLLKDKNKKFVVIGEGMERNKLERLIKKYKLNNFFLIGAISDAYKYVKAFDIFVLPSVKEGFPWTILEAMLAEVPVIATKVGVASEIQPGVLVEPRNAKELSDAIKKMLRNKNLREKLTKKAKETLESKFTLSQMVKEIKKLL